MADVLPPVDDRYARSPAYRWYALGVLALVYMLHAVDRSMPSILVEPVRHEFGLSDGELGLYSGVAYGVAFCLFVLPVGHLSDRVSRKSFLALLLFLWSLFTVLGGFVKSYSQLVLTRFGVGAAESGGSTTIMPMLSDIVPEHQRASIIGFIYLFANLGGVIAVAGGGYIAEHYGWRTALLFAGLPGVLCAALLYLTVDEPRRGAMEAEGTIQPSASSFLAVLRYLVANPALILLIMGAALMGLVSISLGAWATSFFIRVHDFSLTEVGLLIGLVGGAGGMLSPPLYGWIGDRMARHSVASQLQLVSYSAILAFAAGQVMLFVPIAAVAVACFAIGEFLRSGYPPPAYSVLMAYTPVEMRGTMTSLLQFATLLIGFGLGPLAVGLLSDFFGGGMMIRYALASALLVLIPIFVLIHFSARMLMRRQATG